MVRSLSGEHDRDRSVSHAPVEVNLKIQVTVTVADWSALNPRKKVRLHP